MANITFNFPFTIEIIIVAITAYIAASPLIISKFDKKIQFAIWAFLAIIFTFVFSLGYGLRFILGIAIMVASRMRITQVGFLKEVLMLVITLVTAMLFIGLR